jgi:hypothetical protein
MKMITTPKKLVKMRQIEFPKGDAIHVVIHGTTTLGQISKNLGIYATMRNSLHEKHLASFTGPEWNLVQKLLRENKVELKMIDMAYLFHRYKITMKHALEMMYVRDRYDSRLTSGGILIPLHAFTVTGVMVEDVEVVTGPDPQDLED